MKHRFFVPPKTIDGEWVRFSPEMAHQMRSVLRLRPGETVYVLDNSGREWEVELDNLDKRSATGRVRASQSPLTEPVVALRLYQCVLKGDRFEWVLQKGTELGVSTFVPVISERTILSDPDRIEKKRPRWERILREAAEQSGRVRLPRLSNPLSFAESCRQRAGSGPAFIPWEESSAPSLSQALDRLAQQPREAALWIGPEGGLTAGEVALASGCGIEPVTLGPRILRAETASVAATAILMASLGQLGG